jgi:ADP-ribosylglycohydrolase
VRRKKMAWLTLAEKAEVEQSLNEELAIKEQVFGALYGGIVGDALGVPFENKKRGSFAASSMEGFGTYNQEPGTWSDDSALTLCLVENFVEAGDPGALMEKFARFADRGYWTPRGEVFDIGNTTRAAINRRLAGFPASECGMGAETDNGNGALMRIAPVALSFMGKPDFSFAGLAKAVADYAGLTHAHPRSTLGCIMYVFLLYRLSCYDTFEEALEETIRACQSNLKNTACYGELDAYSRIFNRKIPSLRPEEVYSDGYVVHTLEAALWCMAKHSNYRDTVLAAVNLGDDTDTTAAVAGTMAGLRYSYSGIPPQWVAMLARKEDIDRLLILAYRRVFEKNKA